MSKMIERVARAIAWAPNSAAAQNSSRDEFMRIVARAAIAAMREPTEAMVEAGDSATGPLGYGDDPQSFVWPAMIDAALLEGPCCD